MPYSAPRPATEKDALFLSERLRAEDIKEIYASSGRTPLEALLQGMKVSTPHAWVLEDQRAGTPYLMGGVRPIGGGFGIVWMLASPDIERHALTVQREARRMLLRIWESGEYRAVCNVVHADNHKAVAWLASLGFIFVHKDQPVGRRQERFHSFAMPNPLATEACHV